MKDRVDLMETRVRFSVRFNRQQCIKTRVLHVSDGQELGVRWVGG